ncbi:transcriptional regulator STERILE APETALA [Typha latifolia]|uniref:transcriptional regulator STERILE APETALA n=1 Tax=Typha latifolia TaxID=4733 RepID=UPI003C302103
MSASPPEGGGGVEDGRRRDGDPSSSRRRSADMAWPEHFVEAVAAQVAVNAAASDGRLAAAPAIATFFQVCSAWRAVSQSEMLWQDITCRIWRRQRRLAASWQIEFARLHCTGRNFRSRRSAHSLLLPATSPLLACCCLALSDRHLAAGFLDGNVRLFDIPNGDAGPIATYHSHPEGDRLGRFSQTVSGLLFLSGPDRLVFACKDGNIHVADIEHPISGSSRRACVGNLVEDGTLVDFTGNDRWWVGLFAGVPGRSWHVWDVATEELMYVGGALTDPDAVLGWHMLTDLDGPIVARARMAAPGHVVGCTSSKIQVMDINDPGDVVNELELVRGCIVDSMDGCEGLAVAVDWFGTAKVYSVPELEEVGWFNVSRRADQDQGQHRDLVRKVGCMNWGYAIVCCYGRIRVYDVMEGKFLYSFMERIGEVRVMAVNDRFVAAWSNETGLHLWDFQTLQ